MLKRIIISLLLSHYAVFSVGVGVHVHYCLGFVQDVSIGFVDEVLCCCPSDEMMKHCCEDEQLHFKISDDHQQLNYDFSFESYSSDIILPSYNIDNTAGQNNDTYSQLVQSRPPPKLCESRIRLHSLIFYS